VGVSTSHQESEILTLRIKYYVLKGVQNQYYLKGHLHQIAKHDQDIVTLVH
jgi:hypothetical protein